MAVTAEFAKYFVTMDSALAAKKKTKTSIQMVRIVLQGAVIPLNLMWTDEQLDGLFKSEDSTNVYVNVYKFIRDNQEIFAKESGLV